MFRIRPRMRRILCTALVGMMLAQQASAVIYNVKVYGVRSINDLGDSDYSVSMETIQDAYEDFQQDSHLTEYFYQDQGIAAKLDLGEEISWLIDNNVIQRDQTVSISGGVLSFPTIRITKANVEEYLPSLVCKSDLIMYLYKAVYGPIDSRPIGFEAENFRTYHESYMLFSEMLEELEKNDERYSPQGDDYTTIFGDTNIFIADNDIHDNVAQSGDADSIYGSANSGDVSDNQIQIESDYKRIEYDPGADLFLYFSGDVLELYIQAALSKGIISSKDELITDKFMNYFNKINENNLSGATVSGGTKYYSAWDSDNAAYVPNMSINELQRLKRTNVGKDDEALGVNYKISDSSTALTITRNNFFSSNSGYFQTEKVTKMDIYRLIYQFISAGEKKLSDLETDIVNYKYGMELDGLASSEDVAIIKYLIAKGILNYDGVADFQNLYSSMTWYDFLPILYRVANKDARLDFSSIQLTDSEASWKAKGYAPQTLKVTEEAGYVKTEAVITDSDPEEFSNDPYDNVTEVSLDDGSTYHVVNLNGSGTAAYNASYLDCNYITLDGKFNLDSSYLYLSSKDIQDKLSQFCEDQDLQGIETLLSNLYVVMYGKNSSVLSNGLMQILEQWGEDDASVKKYGKGYINLWKSYLSEFTTMKMITNATTGTDGKAAPGNCTWYAAIPYDSKMKTYLASKGIGANDQEGIANVLLEQLSMIELTKYDSDMRKITYLITFDPLIAGRARSIQYSKAIPAVVTVSQENKAVSSDGSYYASTVSAKSMNEPLTATSLSTSGAYGVSLLADEEKTPAQQAELTEDNVADYEAQSSQLVGNSLTASTTDTGIKVQTSKDSGMAFVSWNDIKAYNDRNSTEKQIPITKISDLVLYNSETDTYAYFSTSSSQPVAIVGTAIVSGDPSLGVAFKSGDGESAEYYYLFDAIKLLMTSKEETTCIGGLRSVNTQSKVIEEAASFVPLVMDNGDSSSKVTAIKACISKNATSDANSLNTNSLFNKAKLYQNTKWDTYISLSSANRVMNIIYHPFTYTDAGQTYQAYKVVKFKISDNELLGSGQLTSTSTLQEVLDAPGVSPTTAEGQKAWAANQAACNAFANWVYGTSGQTYISTGYLEPEAYVYVLSENPAGVNIPAGEKQPLTTEQQQKIKTITCKQMTGAVVSVNKDLSVYSATQLNNEILTGAAKATYYLSEDLQVIISDGRLYLNFNSFGNMYTSKTSNNELAYAIKNTVGVTNCFTLGNSFYSLYPALGKLSTGETVKHIKATVVETKSDGTIVCQVGPFSGLPIYAGGKTTLLSTIHKTDMQNASISELQEADLLEQAFKEMFANYGTNIKYLGIATNPIISLGSVGEVSGSIAYSANRFVASNNEISYYTNGKISSSRGKLASSTSVSTALSSVKLAMKDAADGATTSSDGLAWGVDMYFQISFPVGSYRVQGGYLHAGHTTLSDVASPALYANLNDLIIDGLMNEANGAIPLNEVPNGSMVQIGENWYTPATVEGKKTFIGYSAIPSTSTGLYAPTMSDATMSFMPQMIRIGNQYVNVSHFFSKFTMLEKADGAYATPLSNVVTATLQQSSSKKWGVNQNGDLWVLFTPEATDVKSQFYAAVAIEFSDGLLAYKCSGDGTTPEQYKLCGSIDPDATGIVDSGALSKLPFWTDNTLLDTLNDVTMEMLSAGYIRYTGAGVLMDAFRENFQKAFEGDVFTLCRLIAFCLLCWLFVSSWICFAMYYSRITPILELIKYPTNNRSAKGIDLMRVISLGTISLETEFTLGRFFCYDLIIAILIVVVWKIQYLGG